MNILGGVGTGRQSFAGQGFPIIADHRLAAQMDLDFCHTIVCISIVSSPVFTGRCVCICRVYTDSRQSSSQGGCICGILRMTAVSATLPKR